jgi:hypothetical protein
LRDNATLAAQIEEKVRTQASPNMLLDGAGATEED